MSNSESTTKKLLISAKEKIINFYYRNGNSLGVYLLKAVGVAALIVLAIMLISKAKTFSAIFELIVALPLFSLFVVAVRLAIKLVHIVIPMRAGIVKFIFDFIVFGIVMMSLGYVLDKIPTPGSDSFQIILTLLFDILYLTFIVFCLLANKLYARNLKK